jgi:DNA polymerase III epsilon subunit-like protein
MNNIFIDIESTGLDHKTGQIVEIAIVDSTGRCLLSTRYDVDYNLKLQPLQEIKAALDYNRLTEDVLSLYKPIDKHNLSLIEAILTQADLVIAHNADFDRSFLEETSNRLLGFNCFKSIKWGCSMALLAKSKGIKSGRVKLPNMQLGNIPHSALSDAQNCRLLYQSLELSSSSEPTWDW